MDTPIASLSGGQRQSVAICRSAMWAKRVVFMDEPTAALGVVQTGRTLELIRRIRDTGVAVVLISHNMRDVIEVADSGRGAAPRPPHRPAAQRRADRAGPGGRDDRRAGRKLPTKAWRHDARWHQRRSPPRAG